MICPLYVSRFKGKDHQEDFDKPVNMRRQILPLFEFLGIQLPESWPTFNEVSELNNREED